MLFQEPSAEFGDFVTWFWEAGKLTKEHITWQLERLKAHGVSGTWYFPRDFGTDPPYWSNEWREIFVHSVEEHRRLGMKAGFSDWTGLGYWQDRLRQESATKRELAGQRLRLYEQVTRDVPAEMTIPKDEKVVSVSAFRCLDSGRGSSLPVDAVIDVESRADLSAQVDGCTVRWDVREETLERPAEGIWLISVVTAERHDLDYMNPAVVARWMELFGSVHERELGELFGTTLDLFFQDELWILRGSIPYSDALISRIQDDYGYDPSSELTALFRDVGPRTDKIRCDYYEAMSRLLEEGFYRPFAKWHEERGVRLATIATWGRGSLLGQTYHYGDFFRYMRHFRIVGNEDPRGAEPGQRCFIDDKMSSSIHHLYQRDRAAVCGYWRAGWGMTQEQNIAWTHENFAYGMNLYNGNGMIGNGLGGWYEWEPPLVYHRQPYSVHWPEVVSHVSRLSSVLSQGVHCADVALLYPLSTVHAHWLCGDRFTSMADDAANDCFGMAKCLYEDGIDFDFVDDQSLEHATVTEGVLTVSEIEFRCVVMPPMTTIKTSTLELLKRFYDSGGTVIAHRRLPAASQEVGRGDPRIDELVRELFGLVPDQTYWHKAMKSADEAVRNYNQTLDSIHSSRNRKGGAAFFLPILQAHGTPGYEGPRIATIVRDSIKADVHASVPRLLHTHQRISSEAGATEVYFVFNLDSQSRDVEVTFRAWGTPELWDPATGAVTTIYRRWADGHGTTVRLNLERYDGVLVVFTAEGAEQAEETAHLLHDDLVEVLSVDGDARCVVVTGLVDAGGVKQAEVAAGGARLRGQIQVEEPPAPIALNGAWQLTLTPTMDNRWGDFRLPPTERLIGPEAKRFRYRDEGKVLGTDLGWHEAGFDDSTWISCTYSEGPYAHTIGPFRPGEEPDGIECKKLDLSRWLRFSFSQRYGHICATPEDRERNTYEGVPEHFLYFDPVGDERSLRYLTITVTAEVAGEWDLLVGGIEGEAHGVWLNDVALPDLCAAAGQRLRRQVSLVAGTNRLLLKLVHDASDAPIRMYAAFLPPGAELAVTKGQLLTRLPWFEQSPGLVWDVRSDETDPIGWLRFEVPPGISAMRLTLSAASIEAWVDGRRVEIEDDTIRLDRPSEGIARVALRLRHTRGFYGGAAISEPVTFDSTPTTVALKDWSQMALGSYSGGGRYSTTFCLDAKHLECAIVIDLGRLHITAEVELNGVSLGVLLRPPYRISIDAQAQIGENRLVVKVFNTLANYFSTGFPTSAHAPPEQQGGGLIGPVRVDFRRRVKISASPLVENTEGVFA